MRIGFFSESYFPEKDGVTYTLRTWKEKLEDRGHEVFIVYPDSERYSPSDREVPAPSLPNPCYQGYNVPLPYLGSLPELDVVHCHTPGFLGFQGLLYARKEGIPAVYTHHTPLEKYFDQSFPSTVLPSLLSRIYPGLESIYMKQFDMVTSNHESVNRSLKPFELPVGVDMEFFQPSSHEFDFESPVIGYSGRISDEKNIGQILQLAKVFDGTVVIVGEGPKKKEMVDKAPSNVVFKDFLNREKLPGYLSMLDVFVTASTGDTLGLSALEANACGTPVVAVDHYPFNKTIKEGNGYRFKKGDTQSFKSKVEQALNNDWNTRETVEKYAVEKSLNRLEKIYKKVKKK